MTKDDARVELSPCPFCGSANIDIAGWASTETSGPACDDCGGSAGSALEALAQNVAAWNTRHQSTTDLRAKADALAEALDDLVGEELVGDSMTDHSDDDCYCNYVSWGERRYARKALAAYRDSAA